MASQRFRFWKHHPGTAAQRRCLGVLVGKWPEGPILGLSVIVNQELVRRVRRKDQLLVHSNMEQDVGLLRLYPGIPASLVGLRPAHPHHCP